MISIDRFTTGQTAPSKAGDADGPLASLQKSKYNFDLLRYPRNLGSPDAGRGHWINFYINVNNSSKYVVENRYQTSNDPSTAQQNQQLSNQSANNAAKILGLSRPTKRITQGISLYMPDTMNVTYGYDWQDVSLDAAAGPLLGEVQDIAHASGAITEAWKKNNGISAIVQSAMAGISDPAIRARAIGAAAGALGGDSAAARDLALYTAGLAVNPQLEVLFKGLPFRHFQFDFLFSPEDVDEAYAVRQIIRTFKFHAAPELDTKGTGRYWIMPSEFDIEFIQNGQTNYNVHRISTCVCTGINVDYAPNGWATHWDGMPVQTRMTLSFQEVDLMTKQRIDAGF